MNGVSEQSGECAMRESGLSPSMHPSGDYLLLDTLSITAVSRQHDSDGRGRAPLSQSAKSRNRRVPAIQLLITMEQSSPID